LTALCLRRRRTSTQKKADRRRLYNST